MEKIIKIEDGYIDIEKIKKIIIYDWEEIDRFNYNLGKRGEWLYKFILDDVSDCADALTREFEGIARERLLSLGRSLDRDYDVYPKSDVRSIGFEVLRFLRAINLGDPIETLTKEDIPSILEFLDTPADKLLEGWDKWEKYWNNLDYPERRKKLLEDKKYNYRTTFYAPINIECPGDLWEAQNLLYALTKEFSHKKLVTQGNEVVQNGKLRIFYQCESGIRIQLSPSVNFDIIEEKIKNSENSDHPRVITNIIKNI